MKCSFCEEQLTEEEINASKAENVEPICDNCVDKQENNEEDEYDDQDDYDGPDNIKDLDEGNE